MNDTSAAKNFWIYGFFTESDESQDRARIG